MVENACRWTVGTCRGLLYGMLRKSGETKTTEVIEPASNEYDTKMLSEKYSNSKKLSPL
jgi:hypothetical protein